MPNETAYARLRDALHTIRALPGIEAQVSGQSGATSPPPYVEKLNQVVLPSLDFDLPVLLVAICGGGSTGKSTIFNMLAGGTFSSVGFKAGLTMRVLLAGHPQVLSGAGVAQALLYRLRETPQPWQSPADTLSPGPPLFKASETVPRNLLLLDTPDFDTGEGGKLLNRDKAEPILRAADVILYVFTNTVYNNLSNTQFMADVVGGIGGRPVILVYRISRAASDEEVLEHCRVVANKLYHASGSGFPGQIAGVYRSPESDAVALGKEMPQLIPLTDITRGRELPRLLADLDVAGLKRRIFATDLEYIRQEAAAHLRAVRHQAKAASLYRMALQQAIAQQALQALKTFPLHEAVGLATRLFIETGPAYIKVLRGTGRVVSAPLRALQWVGRNVLHIGSQAGTPMTTMSPEVALSQDLMLSANELRNRLMDDHLIIRTTRKDALYTAVEQFSTLTGNSASPVIEPTGSGTCNLHIPVPEAISRLGDTLLAQDWEATTQELRHTAHQLVGLPTDIEDELRALVIEFRSQMGWQERLRETFFASLSALPPILGITYTLLTANPVSGAGIWIKLQSLFGINDLWALVSIPASAGLSSQERKQLELTITPVFQLWLQRRMSMVVDAFSRTICKPVFDRLNAIPSDTDTLFGQIERAIQVLGESS